MAAPMWQRVMRAKHHQRLMIESGLQLPLPRTAGAGAAGAKRVLVAAAGVTAAEPIAATAVEPWKQRGPTRHLSLVRRMVVVVAVLVVTETGIEVAVLELEPEPASWMVPTLGDEHLSATSWVENAESRRAGNRTRQTASWSRLSGTTAPQNSQICAKSSR